MPSYKKPRITKPINQKFKDKLRQQLQTRAQKIKALELHELFKRVNGNALGLKFLASCHIDKSKPKELIQLYARWNYEMELVRLLD